MPFPSVECRIAWRPEQFNRVTNPGFETNTTGWSVSAGALHGAGTSITRITTDDHSGSASASLVLPATAETGVDFDFGSAPFFASSYGLHYYRFAVWLKSVSGTTQARLVIGSEGTADDRAERDITLTPEWRAYFVDWAPSATRTDVQLAVLNVPAVAATLRLDDVAVWLRSAFSQVENGYFTADTGGYSVSAGINAAGTSITRQTSGGYFGAECGRLVTTGSNGSGMNWDLGLTKFTQGRRYRARARLRSISGSTSARLRLGSLGTGADRGDSTVTITSSWALYEVDWVPSADRTDAELAITNGSAAAATFDVDGVEIFEALDDVSDDAFDMPGAPALRYGRGVAFDGSGMAQGFANVRLVNDDGKYSKENASGALYGLLDAGKLVLIRADYDGAPYPLFAGSLGRIVPSPMSASVDLICRDPLHDLARDQIHKPMTDEQIHDARELALTGTGVGQLRQNMASESGPIETLRVYRGTDDKPVLAYFDELNAATGSLYFVRPSIYANKAWELVVRDRTVHSDGTTTSEHWNDDMADVAGYDVTDEALVNRQRVDVTSYSRPSNLPVIEAWDPEAHSPVDDPDGAFYFTGTPATGTAPTEVLPLTIPANETRVLHFSFSLPLEDMSLVTSYASGDATETLEAYPSRCVVTLVAGSSGAVLNAVGIWGRALTEQPLNDVDERDEESAWLYGEHEGGRISSPYLQHPAYAAGIALWRIWRYAVSRARPTISIEQDYDRQLTREVADRIEVTLARLSISAKPYVILSFETVVTENARDWRTTYHVEELPEQPAGGYFELGASALGGSAELAI